MIVGVPGEIKNEEYRVGIVPGGVRMLVGSGHRVLVERGARSRPIVPVAVEASRDVIAVGDCSGGCHTLPVEGIDATIRPEYPSFKTGGQAVRQRGFS